MAGDDEPEATPPPDDEIGVGGWQLSEGARMALRRASIDQALRGLDLDRASVELEEILEDNPSDLSALRLLAAVETERRDTLTARAAWESVVDLDPDDASAWLQVGFARFEAADLEGALEAAGMAATLSPSLGEAWYLQALVRERQDQPGDVEALYVKAFSLHPSACPLPLPIPDPREIVRTALRECDPSVRAFWHDVPIRLHSFPAPERLLASVPPLSPRILAAYEGEPGDNEAPAGLDVFVGNLRHHDAIEQATQALADAIEAEAWAWAGNGPRP